MLSNCRSAPDSQPHTTYEAQLHQISTNLSLYTTQKPSILPTFTHNPSSAKIPFPPRKNKYFVIPFKNSHITAQSVNKFSDQSSNNSPRKNEAKTLIPKKTLTETNHAIKRNPQINREKNRVKRIPDHSLTKRRNRKP